MDEKKGKRVCVLVEKLLHAMQHHGMDYPYVVWESVFRPSLDSSSMHSFSPIATTLGWENVRSSHAPSCHSWWNSFRANVPGLGYATGWTSPFPTDAVTDALRSLSMKIHFVTANHCPNPAVCWAYIFPHQNPWHTVGAAKRERERA